MSWKILVSAGLLCVVVSPVLAAPTMTVDLVRSGGLPVLDASGNWQWVVSVTPDGALFSAQPPNGTGGSVATELGFTASTANGNLVSIAANATNFPQNQNPGTAIAGFPAGPGAAMSGNNAVAFLGSDFFTTATAKDAVTITTKGPSTTGSLTSTLAWLGAYTGKGRIAQAGQNFDTFSGSQTKTVVAGDTNLSGNVSIIDYNALLPAYNNGTGKHWQDGDYNGSGNVNIIDYNLLLPNYNQSFPPAPGGGAGAAVPEPGSIALMVIGSLLLLARKFRR